MSAVSIAIALIGLGIFGILSISLETALRDIGPNFAGVTMFVSLILIIAGAVTILGNIVINNV